MAITIRVRNFQSIEDATVVLDGFTVVTGPNNSGKTAFLRAIRGVFTNAPAGPLVRHGAAYLSVEITFDDGQSVLWEKGWEKPGQKGGTVNRYVVNGKPLSNVGRGCPPEVEALGIRNIPAGTATVWPQIADQFSGTLFLVGSPGSAVAEAIADVDRVGKLSAALKLAESDKRKTTSTLNVRREDQKKLDAELETFLGLDSVITQVEALGADLDAIEDLEGTVADIRSLRDRHGEAQIDVERLVGVGDIDIPTAKDTAKAVSLRDALRMVESLKAQHTARQGAVAALEGVARVPATGNGSEAQEARQELQGLRSLRDQKVAASQALEALAGVDTIEVPDAKAADRAQKAKEAITYLREVQVKYAKAKGEVGTLEAALTSLETQHTAVQEEVTILLSELGVCPTCRQSMDDHQHGETV